VFRGSIAYEYKEQSMKFTCLGYVEEKKWDAMSKSEQDAMIEECFSYDDELHRRGHWLDGGQALQSVRTAKTLRFRGGKVIVTDGPFAETKEQLGGLGVLEAKDMAHAIELMSKHPGVRLTGCFEIRPVDEEAFKRRMALDAEFGCAPANTQATTMKFASLGYAPEKDWNAISKEEKEALVEECIAFDKARRKNGQWLGGIALQDVGTAKTLRSNGSKVTVTDGPFAETKEHLGGVVVIGTTDMDDAIELLSKHPGLRFGLTIEIRPIDEETNARWEARQNMAGAAG
jgi:hypothetical protein